MITPHKVVLLCGYDIPHLQVAPLWWCKGPDIGLPAPDAVFYLTLSPEAATQRGNYGTERYETAAFQAQAEQQFTAMRDDSWLVIDASQTVEAIHQEVLEAALKTIKERAHEQIQPLWDQI